jgi:signal transduction histidine kinase
VEENRDSFIFRFRDWGIGVQRGLEDRIFESGFRAPEALAKHVSGSGLGLSVARAVVHELGGDLRLVTNRKPTEFQMTLPKSLKEAPAK